MRNILAAAIILSSQVAFAQITQNVGDFTSLKVYDQIKVMLYHSGENSVESSSSDVEVVNKNGELKIRMKGAKILQGTAISVKVYYDELCDIQASQGSSVSAEEDLKCKTLNLTSNEGSDINLMLNTEVLHIKTNSGGSVEVSGIAEEQNITVNSAGKYLGKRLDSKRAIAQANAGGTAVLTVSESIDATTRAGGNIDVYGDPEDREVKNVIGGKINFK